jgi:hypothetical protein
MNEEQLSWQTRAVYRLLCDLNGCAIHDMPLVAGNDPEGFYAGVAELLVKDIAHLTPKRVTVTPQKPQTPPEPPEEPEDLPIEIPPPPDPPPKPDPPDRSGYIYLLGPSNGLYKIGRTIDVEQRLKSIQTYFPHKLNLVCCHETSDMYNAEGFAHALFEDKRVRGEWFELSPNDVQCFKDLRLT